MSERPDDSDAAWEQALCAALARLPEERAPRSLQRRLRRIPRREGWRYRWLRPAWALALLVPLVAVVTVQQQRLARQEAELAQARQDLAVALSYIEKANTIAAGQINAALTVGLAQPVVESTRHGLQLPMETTLEIEL
jgi:hypothetical protein